jgi:transposase
VRPALLRACLVKVRVRIVSYALSYEKDISNRPLRCPVDPFAIVPARPKGPGKATHPLLARCFRRHLLRLKKWLPLAAFAPRLPSLAYGLLSLQKVPIERAVVPYLQSPACSREEEGRQGYPTDSSHLRLPERQNHRRIIPLKRLRRPQEHQGAQATSSGRYFRPSALGLRHLGRRKDRIGARCLLAGLKPFVPHLKKIWADGAYSGEKLAGWCKEQGGWELEIVERNADTEGFAVLPHRWIVERTLGWLIRNRRLSKDHERMVQNSETFIEIAMIRLILRRLTRKA